MRHYAANYIFDGKSLIKNSLISIDESGKIIFVGKENDALSEKPQMIFYNGILCPGFVNAHCHLELSDYQKSDEKSKGLSYFITKILNQRKLFNDDKSIEFHDNYMYEKGINLVADVVNTEKTLDIKTKSRISYLNFIEISCTNDLKSDSLLDRANNLADRYVSSGLSSYLTLHSFYASTKKLYDAILNNPHNKTLSIHFLESDEELNFFNGKQNSLYNTILEINPDYTPISKNIDEIYDLLTGLSHKFRIILVHNVATDTNKVKALKNCYFCLCPSSNIFLHDNLPNSEFVYDNIEKIIVGTDSIASNTELDVFKEIKLLSRHYPALSLTELLRTITSTGAEALDIPQYGKFSIGESPGVVLLNNIDLINLKITEQSYVTRIV